MAKCAICDKTQSNGNKLSITRSHISKRSPRTVPAYYGSEKGAF